MFLLGYGYEVERKLLELLECGEISVLPNCGKQGYSTLSTSYVIQPHTRSYFPAVQERTFANVIHLEKPSFKYDVTTQNCTTAPNCCSIADAALYTKALYLKLQHQFHENS